MAWQHARPGYEYTHFMMNVGDQMEETDSSFPTKHRQEPCGLGREAATEKEARALAGSLIPWYTVRPSQHRCRGTSCT